MNSLPVLAGNRVAGRVPLCQSWDIPPGLGRSFRVGGRLIAVFKARDGKVFAVDGTCPHKNGPLADGMVVGHQVVCPLHAFRFAADSGNCDQPGVCPIGTYPVEVEGDTVFVTVPQG
ncbi:MAG TPA: Rieske 2Fe-2S domain-containing protein [Gemmataceae bacterium]|nr:Rieske 2Fe-2S domain-containing protein [Gemmataceae bacterium]